MARYWLLAAAAGLVSAAVFVIGNSGSPSTMILAYLAPAPLFLAGLALGWLAALAAGAAGTLLALLIGGPVVALGYLVINAAPVAILVRQALLSRQTADGSVEWYPPGLLAAWLTGIGMAGLAAMALALIADGVGLEDTVRRFTAEFAEVIGTPHPELFVSLVAPLLPGSVAAVWMLTLTVNGALAQAGAAWVKRNRRPAPDIGALHLPFWPAVIGAAAAVAGLSVGGDAGYFLRNLAVVAAVPFLLQGLSVVHVLSRRTGAGIPMLAVFYTLLVVLGWVSLLIVLLGLVEQVVGIRARLAQGSPDNTDE